MTRTQQAWNWLKSRVAVYWDALAGDFDYSKDCFVGLDIFMILAGVRFNTANARKRRLWNIYRVAILLPFVITSWNFMSSVIHHEKLGLILSISEIMIGSYLCLAVMFIFGCNYEPLMEVRRYINRRYFGRDRNSAFLVRSKQFHRNRRIVLGFVLCHMCAIIMFFVTDLSNAYFYRLPFDVREQQPWLQGFCEMTRNILLEGATSMFMLMLTTVYIVLTGMRTELAVIAESFGFIFEQAGNRTQQKLESEPGSSNQLEAMTTHYILKFVHEELKECVQLHQEFLKQLNVIKPLLNATFLIVYYSTTVSIGCGVFYLLYVRTFSMYALIVFYSTGAMLIGNAIFTRLVTQLTETTELIGEQLYDLDWPMKFEFIPQLANEYRSMRQTILIVMIQSQQPLRLNCFGFFEFTQEQFVELVNMAYSLVSFFRNFV